VLKDQKKLLPKSEIIDHHVPKWPELSVAKIHKLISGDTQVMAHLPDDLKHIERDFFWSVVLTLKHAWGLFIIAEARKKREENGVIKGHTELKEVISDKWATALLRHTQGTYSKYQEMHCDICFLQLLGTSTHGSITIEGFGKFVQRTSEKRRKIYTYTIQTTPQQVQEKLEAAKQANSNTEDANMIVT
jgi:hypothetical protein